MLSAVSLGRPSTRSPMMLRWICDAPAAIVSASTRKPLLDELVAVDVQRVAVEHAQAELAEALAGLGVRELHHHRARADGTARRLRHVALRQRPQRVELGGAAAELAAVAGIVHERREVVAQSQRVDELADERRAPLVLQRHVGDAPAVVLGADPVRDRDAHVGEEHLGELRASRARSSAAAPRCRAGPSAGSATRCRGASARRDRCARGTRRRRRPGRTSTRSSGRSARSRRRRARHACAATRGRSPRPARRSPGTTPRRRAGSCGRCVGLLRVGALFDQRRARVQACRRSSRRRRAPARCAVSS